MAYLPPLRRYRGYVFPKHLGETPCENCGLYPSEHIQSCDLFEQHNDADYYVRFMEKCNEHTSIKKDV